MARLSKLLGKLPLILFVGSVLAGVYGYGAISHKYELFPIGVLQRAKAGIDALSALDDEQLMYVHIDYADAPTEPLAAWLDGPHPVEDLILVQGGFEQHPEICPQDGCIAWIMDRYGRVYHSWHIARDGLFSAAEMTGHQGFPTMDNVNVTGVSMTEDGGLVATLQGRNMFPYQFGSLKLDRDSNLVWKQANQAHHWPFVAANGDVILPWSELERPPEQFMGDTHIDTACAGAYGAVYEDGFQILDAGGEVLRRVRFEDLFQETGLAGLAYAVRDGCNPYHVNGVVELNAAAAGRIAGASEGDLLLSLRSSSALVVVDRHEDVVYRVYSGPMAAQHSPQVTPEGEIILFDNLGGARDQGGSRILSITPETGLAQVLYPLPGDKQNQLFSATRGTVRLSEDGTRALVGETNRGVLWEVDLTTGQPIWSFRNVTSLDLLAQRTGAEPEHAFALIDILGAEYVSLPNFREIFGVPRIIGKVGTTQSQHARQRGADDGLTGG